MLIQNVTIVSIVGPIITFWAYQEMKKVPIGTITIIFI